jgi:hypothetical protein
VIFKTPFPIENKIIKSGENLEYKVCYCKYTELRPTITRTFVDGIIFAMPSNLGINNPIGCGTNLIEIQIPISLPAGKYRLETAYRYQVNPIRTIDVFTTTEQFEVIK